MKNKILILLISFFTIQLAQAQNRMVLSDNVYLNIDNNAYVVIDNKNEDAITVNSGGNIISEGEGNIVKWNIQDTTGTYVVPFTTNSFVKIPLITTITVAGVLPTGYINFATYETTNDNNTAYPTGVNDMLGSCSGDNSLFAVDRFWRIEAAAYSTKPTPIISFGYDDAVNEIGATNTIIESKLKAQRYNTATNSWETPQFLYGIANATLNQVQNSSVAPTDFYMWWTLVDTSAMIVTDTVNVTICSNDSLFLEGAFQNTPGFYVDTVTLALVCDTNKVTNLTVLPTTTGTDVIVSCTPITWIDGNNYAATNNTATFNLVAGSANGCDSLVSLDLTINSSTTGTDVIVSCTPITWIDGTTYTSNNTTATDTIFGGAANGCDSLVSLDLTINSSTTGTDVIVSCTPITWIDGTTYSATNNTATFNLVAGSANGCDSLVSLDLTINPSSSTTNIYNECDGFSVTVGANMYNTTGVYTDIINNCDTVITDLTINPAPQITLIKTDDNCGENTGSVTANVVSASPPVTYNWSTGATDSVISNLPAGTYTVTINDTSGCTNAETIEVLDLEINCDFFVYVPNFFSPNGDGQNDVFFVRGKGIATLSVQMYNRWGNKVFEINAVNDGWNGEYKGSIQNTAVFVYVLKATFLNGKTVTKSGDVSLVR